MSEYIPLLIDENEIAEREDAIQNIHQEILDVHEIFKMLGDLTHQQGYLIDNIEQNIEEVVVNVERADVELVSASEKQKRKNKCLLYIFFLLAIILLIVVLTLLFTLNNK
jgi:syntaxin 7